MRVVFVVLPARLTGAGSASSSAVKVGQQSEGNSVAGPCVALPACGRASLTHNNLASTQATYNIQHTASRT